MDADLYNSLNGELRLLKHAREQYVRRKDLCHGLESVHLKKVSRKNGKVYYYEKRMKKGKYAYVGTKDSQYVKKVCEARYLNEAIHRIDQNINLINRCMQGFLPYDMYAVNESLPLAYRINVLPASQAYRREGDAWLARRLAFQKEYPENYPERKTELTSDGIYVKTISEVVLYERFKAAGLYQIYELPLVLSDYGPAMYPDITILSPLDMKTEILVEYVGRLDLPKYREDFAKKLGRYIANGYKPGKNLFFIFSDKDGHIDSYQINRVIAEIKGL